MSTPLEAKTKISSNDILMEDPSYYRGIVGALQYLTLTRPDLSFSVNYVSQFMHAPTMTHLKMVRRILRCRLGGVHYNETIHYWLLYISWRKSYLMVCKKTTHNFPIKHRSRISCNG
jgi:hypothetical protein